MRKRQFLHYSRLPRVARLTRSGRWAVRVCMVAPLLVFLVAVIGYGIRLEHLLQANLSPLVAAEITRQTGHETRIGPISLLPLGRVTVDSIAVSSLPTFAQSQGQTLVQADRVTVHYNLRELLFDSGNAAHAVGNIRLDRPNVLVERLAKNQYNFSDILKPPTTPRPKPFVGQVLIHDGTLRFEDYLAPVGLGTRPAFNTLAHVNATVNLHSERTVYFTADGQGTAHRLNTFSVTGDASRLIAGRFRINVAIANADAAYWADYFARLPQAQVTAGRVDLDLTVARLASKPPPGLPVDLLGRIAVRRVAVALSAPALRGFAVQGVTGSANFTGGGVAFAASAAVNGQPVAANGTLSDFAHPQVAVTAAASHLNAEALARAVPHLAWPAGLRLAPVAATISVVGPAARLTYSANVTSPGLRYAGNRLAALRASGVYSSGTLSLPQLTFSAPGGGQANLHGMIAFSTAGMAPRLRLAGQAVGLNLASLRLPGAASLSLGGRADAEFLADSVGHPLRVVADVAVAQPRVSRTQLLSARARLVYAAGQGITVSRALVRAPQGAALAAGTLPVGKAGTWNLRVDAAGLNLASLAGPYTHAPIGGLAYFQGRVGGPAAAPRMAGQVQLLNPRYARFTADVVRGGVAASAAGLTFRDLALDRFPTAASVTGTVTRLASADPALNLYVRVSQADVEDFLNLASQISPTSKTATAPHLPPITGTAQGAFQIAGSVHAPRVAGQADVTNATVGAYRVDSLHVSGSYADGTVRLAGATLRGEGATLAASGALTLKTGQLHGAFQAHNIDLERLRALTDTYADLDGLIGASGTFGGTLKSPLVAATVTANGLAVNEQTFAPLTLSGRYADGELVQTGAPWTLDWLPSAAAGHTQDIHYIVSHLRLALPTAQHPGLVPSIDLQAAIPAAAPETIPHLVQTLRDSRFAGTPGAARLLAEIDALPRPLDGTLAVPLLSVQGPLAAPTVQATLQGSSLILGANTLRSLTANASFADPKNPQAALRVTAQGLLADGVPVNRLTVQASLADHVLTLSRLRATNQSAYLEASGKADLRTNGVLNANLDASDIPLSLLDPLLPQPALERRNLTGQIGSLTVSASGPTVAPNLIASVSLTHPGLTMGVPGKPPRVSYALERLRSGEITLTTPTPGAAQVLTVTDLSAFQNGRPIATLSGSLPFQWHGQATTAGAPLLAALPGGQPLHAQLFIPDLSQFAPFAPALDAKRTAGTLTATLDVTDIGSARRLTGALNLTGGALGLTGFDTALNKIQAHVTLDGTHVTIGQMSAASTKGGTLAVTGSGTLAGASAVRVVANNLTVDESSRQTLLAKTYGAAFRGKLNGVLNVAGPWLTPRISTPAAAPLVVSDATGSIPSAPATQGGPAPKPVFDPAFHVTVLLGGPNRTVAVSNALLHADANGDVHLTGSLSSPDLRAHLSIARGQFYLPPATRLQLVRSGQGNIVDLRYPVPAPDGSGQPSLQILVDLTAQTTVTYSQAQLAADQSAVPTATGQEQAGTLPYLGVPSLGATAFSQAQRYTITAHIHGYLNDPNLPIDLESSPAGLDRQEMLAALTGVAGLEGLTGPNSQAAFQQELTSAIYQGFVPTLLTPLEENIANSLNLSEFDIAYSPDAPVVVTLSKLLAPRLEVTYIRSIGPRSSQPTALVEPPQYTVKLSYGLTRRLQISVSTDDQNNNTVALEGVAGF